MRPNLPFLLAASNALLKPGGLLRWKKRLVKDARLSLPHTEVMKIARPTSPLLDALRQSSPRPRLRHGRRLALLFHPNQTQKLYTLSFALLLALLPPLSNIHNCFSPRKSALVYAAYLRSHFSVSQPKSLRSRARDYLSELRRATCPEESHSSFCSPFSTTELLAAASNLSSSTATGPDKVTYPMLKHLPRSDMDFLLHIFNLSWTSHSFPFLPFERHLLLFPSTRWEILSTLLLPSGLSLSPPAYQSFLNPSFYPVYSSFWSLIPFSLPARPVSALDVLH